MAKPNSHMGGKIPEKPFRQLREEFLAEKAKNSRGLLREALGRLRRVGESISSFTARNVVNPIRLEMNAALLEAGGKRLRKFQPDENGLVRDEAAIKVLGLEKAAEIVLPFKTRIGVLRAALIEERKSAQAEVDRLTFGAIAREGLNRGLIHSIWSSTFSTQTATDHYTRKTAEIFRRGFSLSGIQPELVEVTEENSVKLRTVEIWAKVEDVEVDVAIIQSYGLPIREFVRSAWELGVNPRVPGLLSGLPHGYEEANGLDYFGNDLRIKK